jgi:hypothetical protein
MSAFKWKCPLCETINTDVACKKCTHIPEYYLPLEPDKIKAEKIKPIAGEPFYQQEDWQCPICGTMNPAGQKKCKTCEKNKVKKKASVRGGVIVSVALVSFFFILLVVVGKIIVTSRPEVLTGNWDAVFNIPTVQPIMILTNTPVTIEPSRVYPNPPVDGCKLWSEITPADAGENLCGYGLVVNTYVGAPNQFYVRFSEQPNDFRMVMLNVEEPTPTLIGECVYRTGKVQVYKTLPYISFTGEILICKK